MPTKWALLYETVDNQSAQFIKQKLNTMSMYGNSRQEYIPGFFVFPRESDKTFVSVLVAVQQISKHPKLAGKVKMMRLLRLTDDADMMPAIAKEAKARADIKAPNQYPEGDYGEML